MMIDTANSISLGDNAQANDTTNIVSHAFDIRFDDWTISQTAEKIALAAQNNIRTRIAFVNAHCINEMRRSPQYDEAVRGADMILPDGSGMAIATLIDSGKRCPNLNGTDLAPELMKQAVRRNLSIFLVGARPGVADTAARNLQAQFPGLRIAGTHHGYFAQCDNDRVLNQINEAKPDIVLVAFGVPAQEIWLANNVRKLNAPVTLGVGGLLDFLSGRIPRAPKILRATGLEWTYRLYQEPARMWRRYILGNPIFLAHAVASGLAAPYRQIIHALDKAGRRLLNIVGALSGLLALSPVLLLTALIIRLESPGQAIFRQKRIGKDGTPFTMYKFRSMAKTAERDRKLIERNNHHGSSAVTFKISNDPRVTRVGRFIRKFSIDEAPQLWNVLIGDMSLVGPRPALPCEVEKYSATERHRLDVKPGITCTWQISGRADIDFEGQVALDLNYIKHRSLILDLWILMRTPIAVVTARGAY